MCQYNVISASVGNRWRLTASSLRLLWLLKDLLSSCQLLLQLLSQWKRLWNHQLLKLARINIHQMSVLCATAPTKVLDLHDLQNHMPHHTTCFSNALALSSTWAVPEKAADPFLEGQQGSMRCIYQHQPPSQTIQKCKESSYTRK